MGIALSLLSALAWGAADFCGGIATRRSRAPYAVAILSQFTGLLLALCITPFAGGTPSLAAFELGLCGGVAEGLGLLCLYRALAIGRMGVVSPISAVIAAVVPAVGAIGYGQKPSLLQWVGVLCAVVSVVLVSVSPPSAKGDPGDAPPQRGIRSAIAAGCGFGVFLLFIGAPAAASAGLYPVLGVRMSAVIVLTLVALVMRMQLRPAARSLPIIASTGALDMAANSLYIVATHFTLIAVAAVLSSLYPAATVMLAAIFLRERLLPLQWSGVTVALAGVVLLAR